MAESDEVVRHRQVVRDRLAEWAVTLNTQGAEWDLETVKHLVVLNAAGVAGVATLLSGNGADKLSGWAGPATLTAYGVGVILAVLNLHLAARSFVSMSTELARRSRAVQSGAEIESTLFDLPKKGERINMFGQACGWASAAAAISSTAMLGATLLYRAH